MCEIDSSCMRVNNESPLMNGGFRRFVNKKKILLKFPKKNKLKFKPIKYNNCRQL